MLENGSSDFVLPEIKNYSDHLEYLQDQFFRIDLAQQLNVVKKNFDVNSPSSNRLKSKLLLLENRIKERIKVTSNSIMLEDFFKENNLNAVILNCSIDNHFITLLERENPNLSFLRIDSDISDILKNTEDSDDNDEKIKELFKEILKDKIEATGTIEFNYEIELPNNIGYNKNAATMYKTYYTNEASEATMAESKQAPILNLTTGKGPELEIKLSAPIIW